MINRFKYIISCKSIYKEIPFPEGKTFFTVGMAMDADVRLHREDFSEEFWLRSTLTENGWLLECSESIYINVGDVRKLTALEIKHGDTYSLFSQKTEQELFSLSFLLNFDDPKREYNTVINLEHISRFSIGNRSGCNIRMMSEYGSEEFLEVFEQSGQLAVNVQSTALGCFYNGIQVNGSFRVGQKDFFSLADTEFYYKNNQLYVSGADKLQFHGLETRALNTPASTLEYPKFNRNTQADIVLSEEPIPVLSPSAMPQKPKENLLKSLIPAVLMLVLVVVVRGFMSGNGGGSYVLFSVCSMGLGIGTTIFSYFGGKKEYKEELEQREKDYQNYIQGKRKEIIEARTEEGRLLNEKYPSGSYLYNQVMGFSGNIFDKKADKSDFMHIRLGEGTQEAKRKIECTKQEKIVLGDTLEQIPQQIEAEYTYLNNVPVYCDLAYAGNIGIVGSPNARYQLFKNMVLDVCAHHYYTDVKLFLIVNERNAKQYSWIRYLPHIQDEASNTRNIVCDTPSKDNRFEYLYKELCMRESLGSDVPFSKFVVLVVDDMGLFQHPISRFFGNAGQLGVHFIFFKNSHEELPMNCGQVIDIADDGSGILTDSSDRANRQLFMMQLLDDFTMEKVALKLAPVYCEEISLESQLTKNITLYQLLGIFNVEDLALSERWGSNDVCKAMAAPLGVKSKNQIIYLDLHEKAHGPHGLVAGTTGSGKSEIMQTYILSMATLYSPYEVAFVLIDFKGGGMANQFLKLPHMLGAITDIDGKEIDRSLLSIRAELDRRKELFALAGVNSINQYIQKFQRKEVSVALPHLIIIVDEFAELKAEQPEFMKELISASRIGRSLGVHLILATQKPAGQVSDQIWSNSKFKLCLKVQTQEDSNEVLKSPLAAEILEPGRAYLQVGNNEIFELFQSAYSGASEKSRSDNSKLKEYRISQVEFSGKRNVIFEQKNKEDSGSRRTQLEAVVSHIERYCLENGIEKLPNICLPPLPELIVFPEDYSTIKDKKGGSSSACVK